MSQQAINDLIEILANESSGRTLDDCKLLLVGGGEVSLSAY